MATPPKNAQNHEIQIRIMQIVIICMWSVLTIPVPVPLLHWRCYAYLIEGLHNMGASLLLGFIGVVCVLKKKEEKTMLSLVHFKFIFGLNSRQQIAPKDGAYNFSNIFLGLSQNEPKVIQKWPQSYFQMAPKWSQSDPKNILQWPRIDPRWIWNDPNAILRWPYNEPKMI